MPFVPLALVTSTVADPYFVVVALCLHSLFSGCFGFRALAVGTRVLGRVPFMGCVACAPFQHRSLTLQSSGTSRWCAPPLTFDVRLYKAAPVQRIGRNLHYYAQRNTMTV